MIPGKAGVPGAAYIAWASNFVPFMRRRAWRREWETEVAHAWQRMNRDGEPPVLSVLRLRIPIYSCVIDALWEGTETMKMTGLLNDIRHAVRGMVVKQGILLAGMGVAVGLVAAGAMSRVMGSLLFGVSATDPVTYGTVAIALIVVALAASWIPAMRAGGVNPSNALRAE